MNFSEREYFVYRVRSGIYLLEYEDKEIELRSPTVDDMFRANTLYQKVYTSCIQDRILTQEEMEEFMLERNLWTAEEEKKIEDLNNNLELLKEAIYNERADETLVERRRLYIRRTEQVLKELHAKKNAYSSNTCEGIASSEKAYYLFSLCCYHNNERYEFIDDNCTNLYYSWLPQVLKSDQVRELARTEPWRSVWLTKDVNDLFAHEKGRELNIDQKNIVQWSTMYDSIAESHEAPSSQVIEDDDMLDGWFIAQRKKREQKESQNDIDSRVQNSNISGSQEVYVMARGKQDAKNIHNANSPAGKMIKKQREAVIRRKGQAEDLDFKDRKMNLASQANSQFKGRRR